MQLLKSIHDIEGKTISNIALDTNLLMISFTDGTYTSIEAGLMPYEDYESVIYFNQKELTMTDYETVELGYQSQESHEENEQRSFDLATMKREEEKIKSELKMYKDLKLKYGS